MSQDIKRDTVLIRFRAALDEMYGGRIERVVLFGSRARGDAQPDSDYDMAVFLSDIGDRFAEMNRLADLSTDILDETGEFVHAMPYRAGSYDERTPLMRGSRRGHRPVKPQTAAYLLKAHEFLTKAQGMLDHEWLDEARRAAYLAGLHAARPQDCFEGSVAAT